MNQEAADALVAAGLAGMRQIKGALTDLKGGFCALGLLQRAGIFDETLFEPVDQCPECGARTTWSSGTGISPSGEIRVNDIRLSLDICVERDLIIHLNNDHGMDFIGIARKL